VREEVTDAGLQGWIGLRAPFDPKAAVLLRTTGQFAALSEVERAVPCHGLLWAADGRPSIDQPQRRAAPLAVLRLYQALARRMEGSLEPMLAEDARRYATAFVELAWRRSGRLQGTAAALARLVDFQDATEVTSGPPAVVDTGGRRDVQVRLAEALGDPPIAIALLPIHDEPHRPAVLLDPTRSHDTRATLVLNLAHRWIADGLDRPGAPRELLLLELVRQVCEWAAPAGMGLDLLRAQEVLLGQRLG
jgi:hypothetical protein